MARKKRVWGSLLKLAIVCSLAGVVCVGLLGAYLAVQRRAPLTLPAPGGAYAVGRATCDWVDGERMDPLADEPNTPRELAVWVWYPAAGDAQAAPAPYLPPAWTAAWASDQGLGALLQADPAAIRTHALAGAPLAPAPGPYPVLVMEPGMGRVPADYAALAESLASHGYVVVGINPTYTAFLVVFADGRVALRSDHGAIPDSASPAQAAADAERIGAVWVDDVVFVMDELARVNADEGSPLYGRLDLERIGVFGHSFGGATALAVCARDGRCRAGADLDGTPLIETDVAGVRQPFMFIAEDQPGRCVEMRAAYAGLGGPGWYLTVAGTRHFDFSDLPLRLLGPVRPLFGLGGLVGAGDPARTLEITDAYLVAFFDAQLQGVGSPLLAGPAAEYPEVALSRR